MAAAGGGAAAGRAYSFKVVLLGEGCVGKTSLVLRYCENKFNDKHITTLQVRAPGSGRWRRGPLPRRGRGDSAATVSWFGAHTAQACHPRLGMALANSPWGRSGSWQPGGGKTDRWEGRGRAPKSPP